MSYPNSNATFPMLDMFFTMQRSYLDLLNQTTNALMVKPTALQTVTDSEQVIGVGEEVLAIATHRVPGAATRVRRVVSEVPVERAVELHDETITIERRPANGTADNDVLTEREFVMIDTREIPVVTKHPQVREELVLRREITGRIELVRTMLKRTDVEVNQPQRMPAIVAKNERQHERDREHHKQQAR